jgi:hypothetical protein
MSIEACGEELCFVDPKHQGAIVDVASCQNLSQEKKKLGFRVWGGDKTWIAPQTAWVDKTPPLDLDVGSYDFYFDKNVVRMSSPVCRETGLKIIRLISLENAKIVLEEMIHNATQEPLTRGIWNVTQLLRPWEVYWPTEIKKVKAYRDEGLTEEAADKLTILPGWVKVSCQDNRHFKFGAHLKMGKVVAIKETPQHKLCFIRSFAIAPQARYAHEAMVEVYNSSQHNYCEVEVHSPLVTLGPHETFSQKQVWEIKAYPLDVPIDQIL